MSWQAYVDDHLMCQLPGGGQLAHAAIWGQDGGIWAQDASFPAVTPEEIAALVAGFTDPSALAQVCGEMFVQQREGRRHLLSFTALLFASQHQHEGHTIE